LDGLGVDCEQQLLVYRRYCTDDTGKLQHAVIVLNFSPVSRWVDLSFPEDGQWLEILNEPQETIDVWNHRYGLNVPSHWGKIYFKG
jgi:hypothetical protein